MQKTILKTPLLLLTLIWMSFGCIAQPNTELNLEAYFSAIIVKDIDQSIDWYTDILGFQVENKVESEARGFKQSNLKKGKILIELIELNKAISAKELVPGYTNRTRFIGFFKTGFIVSDFDKWVTHLTDENVNFYGDIVADDTTGKRMVIITDPDYNRIQLFEK